MRTQGVDRRTSTFFFVCLAITIPATLVSVIALAIWGNSAGTKGIFEPSTLMTLGAFGGLIVFSVGGGLAGYGMARSRGWGSPLGAGVGLAICGVIFGPASGAMGLPVINCAFDTSPGVKRELEVLSLETRTYRRSRSTVAVLRHWSSPRASVEVAVPAALLPTVRVGSRIPVITHDGALGFPWRELE